MVKPLKVYTIMNKSEFSVGITCASVISVKSVIILLQISHPSNERRRSHGCNPALSPDKYIYTNIATVGH